MTQSSEAAISGVGRGDGGPAFPVEVDSTQPDGRQTGNTLYQAYGMSLRDYFAGQALNGTMALIAAGLHEPTAGGPSGEAFIADSAYALADAMIARRST